MNFEKGLYLFQGYVKDQYVQIYRERRGCLMLLGDSQFAGRGCSQSPPTLFLDITFQVRQQPAARSSKVHLDRTLREKTDESDRQAHGALNRSGRCAGVLTKPMSIIERAVSRALGGGNRAIPSPAAFLVAQQLA
jgi:hypothetical protein